LEELQTMHAMKTGALIRASCVCGALLAGADTAVIDAIGEYGAALGMAFQLRDDMLEYMPAAATGKPTCNDLREGKITLPLLAVLERVDDARRTELLDRLARCREDEASVDYLRQLVTNEGGLEAAGREMQRHIAQAVGLLADYDDTPYRHSLIELCRFVAERDN
ncbi:MAG: polyprenyl synthetase family protein, partial [Alistipes sp.]|nr:polyprenyl synthetase family protein [Alistipes sp.]